MYYVQYLEGPIEDPVVTYSEHEHLSDAYQFLIEEEILTQFEVFELIRLSYFERELLSVYPFEGLEI